VRNSTVIVLLEKITAFVDAGGMSREEKRQALLENATEADKAALAEFVAWFQEFESEP
jgi:hypothetical protein